MTPATSTPLFKAASTDGPPDTASPLDGTVAFSATFTTAAVWLGQAKSFAVVLTCPSTGAPVGTVKLQASVDNARNDITTPDAAVSRWYDLTFTDESTGLPVTSQAVSGASTIVFEELAAGYRWFRLVWTRGSGNITPTAFVQLKS
jgi:hypothetical protein